MILTKEVAEKNVGRYIDCYKRLWGNYPMQIIRLKNDSGTLAVEDTAGVCMKVEDPLNDRYYDYIFDMVEVAKNEQRNII
ncbi:MAG: hypothetical protein LUE24_13875 [Lachnospiraceae bacterium]|nr:hypothetical protein [Lachnospiraceae bacterium]